MKQRLMGTICLLGILILTTLPVEAITPPIEDAVVHGYWEQVFSDLKADSAGVDDPVGRLLMGHACLATQRNYGATSLFSTVTEPEDLAAWRSYTEDLVARYPDNHFTLYLRGDAKMRQDEFDGAIADFTASLNINKAFLLAVYQRGNLYDRGLKDYEKAEADYRRALEINPRFARAHFNLGVMFNDQKEYDDAIDEYARAIDLDSNYANAYYNRANTLNALGRFDEAVLEFDKALHLRPIWPEAFYNRGNVFLFGKRQYMSAIFDYDKAININETYIDALLNRGIAYSYNGQLPKAISDFNKIIGVDSTNAEAYSNRGNIYTQLEKFDLALADYGKAIALNPELASVYENRGFLYMVKLGDTDKACADWRRACDLGRCDNYNKARENGDCE